MKTFKDVWEDAAANSVSGGGVEMPADVQQDKKRRKKAVYDGRTKEGRKFVERMMARRKAKEDKEKKKLHAQNMKSVEVKEEQQTEEMDQYSDKVKKRIDKLTYKIREAEREKEAALSFAQNVQKELSDAKKKTYDIDKGYM